MNVLPSLVYLLCAATSLMCGALLVRSYRRHRTELLLWSALCFAILAVSNLLLFVDVVLLPVDVDLLPLRHATSFAAVAVLLYGFIWGAE